MHGCQAVNRDEVLKAIRWVLVAAAAGFLILALTSDTSTIGRGVGAIGTSACVIAQACIGMGLDRAGRGG